MTSIVAEIRSTGTGTPLAGLLTAPLGLDVWEVTPEHLERRRLARVERWATQPQDQADARDRSGPGERDP